MEIDTSPILLELPEVIGKLGLFVANNPLLLVLIIVAIAIPARKAR